MKTSLDEYQHEATGRIVSQACKDMDLVGDAERQNVFEVARRKFLILFEEDSDQYREAYGKLWHATRGRMGKALDRTYVYAEMEQGFPEQFKRVQSFQNLEATLDKCYALIDSKLEYGFAPLYLVERFVLRRRVRANYTSRKKELGTSQNDQGE